MKTKRILKLIVLLLLSVSLCIWLVSVVKCEYLTIRYGDQFKNVYYEYTMFSDPDYFKLLEYSENRAVVYYVKRGFGGDTLVFERANEQSAWEFVSWSTVWSGSGSADGFIWPYIR